MMVRKFGVVAATAALLLTSACGGGDRPSVDEVSKSLTDGKAGGLMSLPSSVMTDELADCMAKAIVDSKVSDDAVRALVDGDKDYKGDKDDTEALSGLGTKIAECAKDAVPTQ
ncbi:hypothetical protein [Nocardioides marmoriginsengisoli]|nr:hypothetical protein [Nocardioides marmoriginsengisoli]